LEDVYNAAGGQQQEGSSEGIIVEFRIGKELIGVIDNWSRRGLLSTRHHEQQT
jgi:hypothetical protein